MPSFEGNYFSIVLVGRQNPKILNHDFLISKDVLPVDKEPFKSLLAGDNPKGFSEFVSTPILATIRYGSISLAIEENRFQIVDRKSVDPSLSPIVEITCRYFGRLLVHTPFQLGGMNLKGTIRFENSDEETDFDRAVINRKF